MNNQPFKVPKIAWVILALVLILQVVVVIIAIRAPSGRSYPKVTPQVMVDRVDYDKISQLIHDQITGLHVTNGLDGQPGGVGATGPVGATSQSGSNGSSGLQGSQGAAVQGPKGDTGSQGDAGTPGKSIEIRYNLGDARIEYRYGGEFTWQILVDACTLTNTCLVP